MSALRPEDRKDLLPVSKLEAVFGPLPASMEPINFIRLDLPDRISVGDVVRGLTGDMLFSRSFYFLVDLFTF